MPFHTNPEPGKSRMKIQLFFARSNVLHRPRPRPRPRNGEKDNGVEDEDEDEIWHGLNAFSANLI